MQVEPLAIELCQRRLAGAKSTPLINGPQTLEQGMALQQACIVGMKAAGYRQIGWKCAMPPQDKWVFGPLYDAETFQGEGEIDARIIPERGIARIEPELIFTLKSDLPARGTPWSQAEVDAAIGEAHMAIELIGTRFEDPSQCVFPAMLADGVSNQGLVIGPRVDLAAALAARTLQIQIEGAADAVLSYDGQHPSGLPTEPLAWFANFLNTHGRGLQAGEKIITGTYAGVLEVPLHRSLRMAYAGLGEMAFRFSPRQDG